MSRYQLVMCIQGGHLLRRGSVYTSMGAYPCDCGKATWYYIAEARDDAVERLGGRWTCSICMRLLPEEADHFFLTSRFIPLNDPDLKEKPESYDVPRKRRSPQEMLRDAFKSPSMFIHPNCRCIIEELRTYKYDVPRKRER